MEIDPNCPCEPCQLFVKIMKQKGVNNIEMLITIKGSTESKLLNT